MSKLVSERDQNWRLDTGQGRFVVKIANPAEAEESRDLQIKALRHLESAAPDLTLPRVIPTLSGALEATIEHDGACYSLRLVTWLEGTVYAKAESDDTTRTRLGDTMGRFTMAMQSFGHRAAYRDDFLWNLDNIAASIPYLADIGDEKKHALIARHLERYETITKPLLATLPGAVIHHDANDYNLIVDDKAGSIGLIDFGDMAFSRRINELAVTLAYALMDSEDLITDGGTIINAYYTHVILTDEEWTALPIQMAMRLVMSVLISSHRAKNFPDNDYLLISQKPAFALLERLDRLNPRFLTAAWRKAAGIPATPNAQRVKDWLTLHQGDHAPLFSLDLHRSPRIILSMAEGAEGNPLLDDAHAHWAFIKERMAEAGASYAIGLYGEDRACYRADEFKSREGAGWRSTHLGLDIFIEAGTPLHAPLDGEVVSVVNNAVYQNYGPTIILKHQAGEEGTHFYTLYGHLALETMDLLKAGDKIEAGNLIGYIGTPEVNVGWAPHLHFQIITDLLGEHGDFYGVGEPNRMDVWGEICPDPNLIVGLHPASFGDRGAAPDALVDRRKAHIGPSLSLSYATPLKMVGGKGALLIDHTGREYIDLVNNICHVGHNHPHVVEALTGQAARLNTNTRYLHDNLMDYAERLAATLPDPLSVCFFTCSGTEANELALRIARTVTGHTDMICVDWAYHGNSAACIDVSPYKFNHKGGKGCPPLTRIAQMPDPYRGPFKGYDAKSGKSYASDIETQIEAIKARGAHGPAGLIAESMLGCGGQIVLPDAYLKTAFSHIRANGGLCIADEVQTGFGRDGAYMWAFEHQDVVPDIVTMGKPIGNGHPMAAVVTTPEIARAFANGMEYFNSFGGNPVSCAVGMAVLDVIEEEGLKAHAHDVGAYFMAGLQSLATRHALIGDVRGRGLFIGVELVTDRQSLEPATHEACKIANRLRENGILISTDGPFDNVLKIKPPMAIRAEHIDETIEKLDRAFAAL